MVGVARVVPVVVLVVVLILLLALAVGTGLAARASAQRSARDAATARADAEAARAEASAASERAATAEAARIAAESTRDIAEADARAARHEATVATGEAADLLARASALDDRLAELTGEREVLHRSLAASTGGGNDPASLWALEIARAERRWREAVSPGPDARSPLDDADDPVRAVVAIEVAAVHEETGTTIHLDWQLPVGLGPAAALAAVRAAQEVLASGAKAAETATLTVAPAGEDLLVVLAGIDEDGHTVELPTPLLPSGSSVRVDRGPGTVTARVSGVLRPPVDLT